MSSVAKGTFYFVLACSPVLKFVGRGYCPAGPSVGGICYHAIKRGNAQGEVFEDEGDYRPWVERIAKRLALEFTPPPWSPEKGQRKVQCPLFAWSDGR